MGEGAVLLVPVQRADRRAQCKPQVGQHGQCPARGSARARKMRVGLAAGYGGKLRGGW